MKTWKVIIGDGHQKPVEAKTARGAILAVIAQLGPSAYSSGVHEVRVWPVDDVGAPTAAAKVSIGAGRVVGLMVAPCVGDASLSGGLWRLEHLHVPILGQLRHPRQGDGRHLSGAVAFVVGVLVLAVMAPDPGLSSRPWFMIGAVSASWCSGFAVGSLEGLWKRWKDRR